MIGFQQKTLKMAKWQWDALWKRAAKKHRAQHKLCKLENTLQKKFIRKLVKEIEGLEAQLEERGNEDGEGIYHH